MTTPDFLPLDIAVLTVSDTRNINDDRSGAILVERLEAAGHRIYDRKIIRDDELAVRDCLQKWILDPVPRFVLTTGGTGFTSRDVTPDALRPLITKEIPGFGELFRQLSYEEIGTSTIQSRAIGALCDDTFVFVLPGSPGACKTAMDRILLQQLDIRHRPCNFVELLPSIAKGPAGIVSPS